MFDKALRPNPVSAERMREAFPDTEIKPVEARWLAALAGCELTVNCRLQCHTFDAATRNSQIPEAAVGQHREFMIRRAIDFTLRERLSHLTAFVMKKCALSIQNDVQHTL